jgi:FPC/CPF motif-containing protein YcgG
MEQCVDGHPLLSAPREQQPKGNFCRVDGGVLSRPFDDEPPSPLTRFVHESFRALALNERFSCVGGRAAVRRDAYRFGLYDRLGSREAAEQLGADLTRFIADPELRDQPLTAFVASFVDPVPVDEEHFESLLWSTLQHLADDDRRPWAEGRHADPAETTFAFSFAGTAFFIVGLHANSSRLVRRFAFPTLVFNPHDQFDRLRADGRYARFREVIRARDIALQGTVNPMLRDFGEASEARQYSGRSVDDRWRCPFHAPGTRQDSGSRE